MLAGFVRFTGRINRIFEGSSEVMHLFIAREAVDKHLEVAGALIDPKLSVAQKLSRLPAVALFYATWYPAQWFGSLLSLFAFRDYGEFGAYLRWAARASRRLARSIFHGMLRFGPKLERKQGFLFRAVDVALELFAMTAALKRAAYAQRQGGDDGRLLAAQFARSAQARIDDILRDMWRNDDREKSALARSILAGEQAWLEQGTMGLPFSTEQLRPETMEQYFEQRRNREREAPELLSTGTSRRH